MRLCDADMPTTDHDTNFVAGDDWRIGGTLLDRDGNPLDLTNASIAWTLLDPSGAPSKRTPFSRQKSNDRPGSNSSIARLALAQRIALAALAIFLMLNAVTLPNRPGVLHLASELRADRKSRHERFRMPTLPA